MSISPTSSPTPPAVTPEGDRSLWAAMRRGFRCRCPACGEARLFASYLKLQAPCPSCGLDTARYRADDAPAYFTIAIVGHIVVPMLLMVEKMYQPSTALQLGIAIPVTLGLTLSLLPRIKGALVATNWATEAGG